MCADPWQADPSLRDTFASAKYCFFCFTFLFARYFYILCLNWQCLNWKFMIAIIHWLLFSPEAMRKLRSNKGHWDIIWSPSSSQPRALSLITVWVLSDSRLFLFPIYINDTADTYIERMESRTDIRCIHILPSRLAFGRPHLPFLALYLVYQLNLHKNLKCAHLLD